MRLQSISGLEPTWLVTCDAIGCTAQEALISERDATQLSVCMDHGKGHTGEDIASYIASGRGWIPHWYRSNVLRHRCARCESVSQPLRSVEVSRG